MPVRFTGDDSAGAPTSGNQGSRPEQTPPTAMLATQAIVGTRTVCIRVQLMQARQAGPCRCHSTVSGRVKILPTQNREGADLKKAPELYALRQIVGRASPQLVQCYWATLSGRRAIE